MVSNEDFTNITMAFEILKLEYNYPWKKTIFLCFLAWKSQANLFIPFLICSVPIQIKRKKYNYSQKLPYNDIFAHAKRELYISFGKKKQII